MPPVGRRQGDPDTRGMIVEAARAEFHSHGYNATTIRSVARRAEVDPALIYHYFADKVALYAATLSLPADPQQIMNDAHGSANHGPANRGVPDSLGARLVAGFLAQWEDADGAGPDFVSPAFVSMVQAISSSPEAARSLREFLSNRVWDSLAADEDARWRTAVVSSQLMGLAWTRYVMRAEPLASASLPEVAERVGPVLETLIFGQPDVRNG
jgi:AcrR family transcriptional regulator